MMKKSKIVILLTTTWLCGCNLSDVFNSEQEAIIYGIVSDANTGMPLADASIHDEYTEIGSAGCIVTGSDGAYEFHLSSTDIVMLIAEKENYEPQTYSALLDNVDKNRIKKLDFKLRRATIQYKGTVKDMYDNPIPNAQVYASHIQGNYLKVGTAYTGENGEYTLSVPNQKGNEYNSWTYSVTASKDGYESKTISMGHTPLDNGKDFTINFQLGKK